MWNVRKVVSKGNYNYVIVPEHPNSSEYGYVLEHRIVMENYLGRLLDKDEVVHHIDNDRKNNAIENLELCHEKTHTQFHGSIKSRKWVELMCPNCGKIFEREKRQSFLQKGTKYTCCSAHCRGYLSRYIQLNGITHKVDQAISRNLVLEFVK